MQLHIGFTFDRLMCSYKLYLDMLQNILFVVKLFYVIKQGYKENNMYFLRKNIHESYI